MEEIWKPIPTWENIYSVSNYGRIRSERKRDNTFVGKILKQSTSRHNRPIVSLEEKTRRTTKQIAPIVAEVFLGKRPEGHQIHHIDFNVSNNTVTNLVYLPTKEHIKFRIKKIH